MERTFLQQSWHFEPLPSDDIFTTKLQLSLDIASKHLIGLLSYNFGETFLQQSWHFEPFLSDDIFTTKLQLSLDIYNFGENILATKLTLWASPIWWHFHDKVTTFLGYCFQAFNRSIALQFWREHSCNKVDTLSLSYLMTFSWQSYNIPWILLPSI